MRSPSTSSALPLPVVPADGGHSSAGRLPSAGAEAAAAPASSADAPSPAAAAAATTPPQQPPLALSDDDRSLVLQVAIKCADLGHLAATGPVHVRWVRALEEELFQQGDRERAAGLSVSPLMDRGRAGVSRSQLGFFDIVALPLFRSFCARYPDAQPMLSAVRENYALWRGAGRSSKEG